MDYVEKKTKWQAILWAFFLGAFGAHKFYLGRKKAGWLFLLFCWTFVPAAIAVVDFWVLVFTSDKTFDLKYNQ